MGDSQKRLVGGGREFNSCSRTRDVVKEKNPMYLHSWITSAKRKGKKKKIKDPLLIRTAVTTDCAVGFVTKKFKFSGKSRVCIFMRSTSQRGRGAEP